jgi:hypothetical protein
LGKKRRAAGSDVGSEAGQQDPRAGDQSIPGFDLQRIRTGDGVAYFASWKMMPSV